MQDPASMSHSSSEPAVDSVPGLTDPRVRAFERHPIRTRDASITQSSWRLEIVCAEGAGSIVRVDSDPQQTHWRGDGVFLGWPAERLAAAYQALLPRDETPEFQLNQLG